MVPGFLGVKGNRLVDVLSREIAAAAGIKNLARVVEILRVIRVLLYQQDVLFQGLFLFIKLRVKGGQGLTEFSLRNILPGNAQAACASVLLERQLIPPVRKVRLPQVVLGLGVLRILLNRRFRASYRLQQIVSFKVFRSRHRLFGEQYVFYKKKHEHSNSKRENDGNHRS
jgi:hypothetical protein